MARRLKVTAYPKGQPEKAVTKIYSYGRQRGSGRSTEGTQKYMREREALARAGVTTKGLSRSAARRGNVIYEGKVMSRVRALELIKIREDQTREREEKQQAKRRLRLEAEKRIYRTETTQVVETEPAKGWFTAGAYNPVSVHTKGMSIRTDDPKYNTSYQLRKNSKFNKKEPFDVEYKKTSGAVLEQKRSGADWVKPEAEKSRFERFEGFAKEQSDKDMYIGGYTTAIAGGFVGVAGVANMLFHPIRTSKELGTLAAGFFIEPRGTFDLMSASAAGGVERSPTFAGGKFAGGFVGAKLTGKGAGFALQKTRNVVVSVGSKKVDPTDVFDIRVLEGGERFPTTKNPFWSVKQFSKAEGETAHATVGRFKAGNIGKGASADSGLYVTPKGQASPFFLGLEKAAAYESELTFLPKFPKPTIVQTLVTGIKRVPSKVLRRGFDETNIYTKSRAGEGAAFISRRSEVAFNKKLLTKTEGYTGTTELEAIIPEGTTIIKTTGNIKNALIKTPQGRGFGKSVWDFKQVDQKFNFFQKLKGYREYTSYKGANIPIRTFKTVSTGSKGTGTRVSTAKIGKYQQSMSDYLKYRGSSSLSGKLPAGYSLLGRSSRVSRASSASRLLSSGRSASSISRMSSSVSRGSSGRSASSISRMSSGVSRGSSGRSSGSILSRMSSGVSRGSSGKGSSFGGSSTPPPPPPPTTPPPPSFRFSLRMPKEKGIPKRGIVPSRGFGYTPSFAAVLGKGAFGIEMPKTKVRTGKFTGLELRGLL